MTTAGASEGGLACKLLGNGCFTGDTGVVTGYNPLTGVYSETLIDQVKVGDLVLSRDQYDASGAAEREVVTGVQRHVVYALQDGTVADGAGGQAVTIRTTAGQPFYVDGQGWTGAGALTSAERVELADGKYATAAGDATVASDSTGGDTQGGTASVHTAGGGSSGGSYTGDVRQTYAWTEAFARHQVAGGPPTSTVGRSDPQTYASSSTSTAPDGSVTTTSQDRSIDDAIVNFPGFPITYYDFFPVNGLDDGFDATDSPSPPTGTAQTAADGYQGAGVAGHARAAYVPGVAVTVAADGVPVVVQVSVALEVGHQPLSLARAGPGQWSSRYMGDAGGAGNGIWHALTTPSDYGKAAHVTQPTWIKVASDISQIVGVFALAPIAGSAIAGALGVGATSLAGTLISGATFGAMDDATTQLKGDQPFSPLEFGTSIILGAGVFGVIHVGLGALTSQAGRGLFNWVKSAGTIDSTLQSTYESIAQSARFATILSRYNAAARALGMPEAASVEQLLEALQSNTTFAKVNNLLAGVFDRAGGGYRLQGNPLGVYGSRAAAHELLHVAAALAGQGDSLLHELLVQAITTPELIPSVIAIMVGIGVGIDKAVGRL